MDMAGVRIAAAIALPLIRLAARGVEDAPRPDHVFDARVLREAQRLGDPAGVAAVRGIVGDIERAHDAARIGVVIGLARAMARIADGAVVALVAMRRERVDLVVERAQAFRHAPAAVRSPPHHALPFQTAEDAREHA
jgi:hypothetical protein